jgi:hypothetical protein
MRDPLGMHKREALLMFLFGAGICLGVVYYLN